MKKVIYVSAFITMAMLSCKSVQNENKKVAATEVSTKNKSNVINIDSTLVRKHLYTLASDDMGGRKPGTAGIEKAAQYIENEFEKIGLKKYNSLPTFRQNFEYKGIKMFNVIGVLEGKSKKDEYVVVSAHYDHLGTKKTGEGDLIFNGANDDASGVTGVLALAKYFKNKGQNERTIVFVAFTAEEMGLIGSTHFGKGIDATKFVAGINLEMIGKTPSFGPNTAWLTGFERSDFGKIIQKNLVGTGYQLFPDPYKKFNLFFRSDNASLARLGVPSHTFSTTPIDVDKDYHKVSDEAETLNMTIITQTIQAVAKGTESIINGKDTPTRVVLDK
ncbi:MULTISPECIES: M20/M25/M40 family metallo-hydrolase [Tenacibaculum]|uniref:M20/M25/M40 family metallo-hydrolase n=1 Tax=Tenacibaculum TaxID=104267 RepID=UPI0021B07BBD|nr:MULTISPECIES: M20/M25/M40 family metallo-hydrolase [Tenacibaculum]MCT4697634.1 M20/M25/M40 family metallo-hydrolase [Tenacibaculum haliotis]WBX71879.1 M20/M25/M40 family metallo-hydrolase [Tenacibaculum retecalamus]